VGNTNSDSPAAELEQLLIELAVLQDRLGQRQGSEALESFGRALQEEAPLTLLVVGEFNTGKSTLINALLGEPILPMGIVPTTATVNVLRHAQEPSISLVYRNGETLPCPWDAEALQKLTIRHGTHEEIAYVMVGSPQVPSELQIIDTPGVNDVCETRAEIVFEWVPKADLVLFLLNAQQGMKQTEMEFLRKRVLGQTLTRVVFVLNHSDRLGESELKQVQMQIGQGLRTIFAENAAALRSAGAEVLAWEVTAASATLEVFPFSGRAALRGQAAHGGEVGGLSHLQAVLRRYLERAQKERLLARKALSMALLECRQLDSYLETTMVLRQASEQQREHFLQGLEPRLEAALTALERMYSEVEALRTDLRSHSAARFARTRQKLVQELHTSCPSAVEMPGHIEGTFGRAIEAELEYTNARLSAASASLAAGAQASDFAVPKDALRGLAHFSDADDDPLAAVFGKSGQRDWLMVLAPIVIWQLGIVGVLTALAAPVVLKWFRQGAAQTELTSRVESALAEIEQRLVDQFGNAVDTRVEQLMAPSLNQIDLLQAALRSAGGREDVIDPNRLAHDRAHIENLRSRLKMLVGLYAG
jgi:predicted GTPase